MQLEINATQVTIKSVQETLHVLAHEATLEDAVAQDKDQGDSL